MKTLFLFNTFKDHQFRFKAQLNRLDLLSFMTIYLFEHLKLYNLGAFFKPSPDNFQEPICIV